LRYWYDTEFIEDGKTIDLISIGIVAEDGREYYAISTAFNASKASDWVKKNVLAHLPPRSPNPAYESPRIVEEARAWRNRVDIALDLLAFCSPEKYGKPEFWGYYSAYDHVALCQLYGTMMGLPRGYKKCLNCGSSLTESNESHHAAICNGEIVKIPGWPMYTRDIKQWCDELGNPELPKQDKGEHHALADARWNRLAWEFLRDLAASRTSSAVK